MKIIEKIFEFFKRLFSKEEPIKMLETVENEQVENENKIKFVDSLKIKTPEKRKTRVETLTCFGDGLGIQTKITF